MEDRIRLLLQKYIDDSCTPQELEEFFSFVRNAEHDDTVRMLIRDIYEEIKAEDDTVPSYVDEDGRLVFGESAIAFPMPIVKKRRKKVLLKILKNLKLAETRW